MDVIAPSRPPPKGGGNHRTKPAYLKILIEIENDYD